MKKILNNSQNPKAISSDRRFIPKQFQKLAQSMEQEFAKMMIEQMKSGIGEDNTNTTKNYYDSLLTNEQSLAMVNNKKGLGIQDLILDQIYPKKFRNPASYQSFVKEQNKNLQEVTHGKN